MRWHNEHSEVGLVIIERFGFYDYVIHQHHVDEKPRIVFTSQPRNWPNMRVTQP